MRSVTSIVRFLGGLLALAAILAGPPIVFWTFRDVLLPNHMHTFADVWVALLTRDSGQVFLTLLAFAGVVAWLQLAAAVLVETTGRLRGLPVRRLAGIGWARKLVAGVLLLMIGTATVAAAAEPPAASSAAPYVVRPGDSLMRIAAEQLGDERRYTEIYALNHARRQPDGETLRDVALIKPGWRLDLPAKTLAGGYRVQRGETLTSIARDRLGNAGRYQEILRLNKNVHNPDLIRAGDTLQLPTAPPAVPAPRPPQPEPPAPPPPVTSPLPEPAAKQESGAQPAPPSGPAVNTPLVIAGAAGLAAAAVLSAVGIRRLRAARRRDLGGAETDPIASLDRALRQLAHHAESEGSKLPGIRMVRLGSKDTTVVLDEPAEPIAPFTATATSTEWRLADPVPPGHVDRDAPYPFLTGLGHDPDGNLILLGLDHVGALLLDGEPEEIAQVAAAIALEIASSPWAEDVTADLVGTGHILDDTDGIEHHQTVDELLEHLADSTERCPHVVIVPSSVAQDDADRLATSDAAADIVAVVAGTGPDTHIPGAWELDLRQRPTPVDQLDVRVALQRLQQDETRDVAETASPVPAETVHRVAREERDEPETPAETGPEPAVPELRLLGPVSLGGVDYSRVEGKKVNRLTELAAFLALNPGVHADEISQQLGAATQPWSAATRQGYISRLRTWLGHDPDGGLYLPNVDAKNGGYRLADTVLCDWFRFQRLVTTATGDKRLDRLQEALDLVEGTPLSNVPRGRYEWGSWHQRDMIDQIVEVAHALVTAYCDAGDLPLARRAAARGLRAEPASEILSRDLLHVEHASGNRSAVSAVAGRLQESAEVLGVPLETDTTELLRTVLGGHR
ncbi:LysM peptidoglycan-binding domain-containing protein [Amycolatopsis echigonensis]|uniref:LysM peptidoglycan-binding domain-containing protein n=1 Tax=Amycolatopsis echigonensis TaxID=2576905 RepID=A0A8E1W7V4_9PSEU|nr:LysM peptidoglycan-binding domain-containing protein [Amycolatopsis echigonensis]MBB2505115.1 LysM peptidoglycan-binding domain-containing protein [Amycolatopsis echigonensis]